MPLSVTQGVRIPACRPRRLYHCPSPTACLVSVSLNVYHCLYHCPSPTASVSLSVAHGVSDDCIIVRRPRRAWCLYHCLCITVRISLSVTHGVGPQPHRGEEGGGGVKDQGSQLDQAAVSHTGRGSRLSTCPSFCFQHPGFQHAPHSASLPFPPDRIPAISRRVTSRGWRLWVRVISRLHPVSPIVHPAMACAISGRYLARIEAFDMRQQLLADFEVRLHRLRKHPHHLTPPQTLPSSDPPSEKNPIT